MGSYGSRFSKPLGGNIHAFGGAGLNLGLEALTGETEMVTTFDDFNDIMPNSDFSAAAAADGTTNLMEECGWILTEDAGVTSVGDTINMNDPADVSEYFHSALRIFPGTADDSGGNMQLDGLNDITAGLAEIGSATTDIVTAGHRSFPHLWIPEDNTADVLDNSTWVFACRVGLDSGAADGLWEGKVFIGWAAAGDTSVMDHLTGNLTDAVGNLHGFHIPEDGSIDGISKRISGDSLVDGTNFTEILPAASVNGILANGATTVGDIMWFDLALRMTITNQSDNAANGATEFYSRPIPKATTNAQAQRVGGFLEEGPGKWTLHGTALLDQTPNHTIALVPTIEVMNGVTGGDDVVFFLDWWSFGCSRFSRR